MHEGHRARMKQRFFKSGLSGMEAHQVLEMLLFASNARGDTNPIAHRLLDKFGSLSAVFDAPYEELLKVEGIGPAAAYLIKFIPPLCGRYLDDKNNGRQRVFSIEIAAKIFANKFIGYTNEAIALMLLSSKGQILYCDIVGSEK